MILNKPQAEAIYIAMCALNNVEGRNFDVTLGLIRVKHDKMNLRVMQLSPKTAIAMNTERFTDQAAFAEAYGLN